MKKKSLSKILGKTPTNLGKDREERATNTLILEYIVNEKKRKHKCLSKK